MDDLRHDQSSFLPPVQLCIQTCKVLTDQAFAAGTKYRGIKSANKLPWMGLLA